MNELIFICVDTLKEYVLNKTSILKGKDECFHDEILSKHLSMNRTIKGNMYFILTLDYFYEKVTPGVFFRIDGMKELVTHEFN